MSMGYDATASLPPLNYTTSFTNPAQWTMNNNANLNQYSQGVLGGTLLDTQRSQQHTADLITSAAMAMPNSPGGAYMFSDYSPGGGSSENYNYGSLFGGGNYASPPSSYSYGSDIGSLFGGGSYREPSINWGNLGAAAGNLYQPQQSYSPLDASGFGAGMFGGLAGGMGGAYQGPNNQIDWGNLFKGGGAQTDPYPNMSMPGGLNSSMSLPQQQPPDYGSLFGQGVGGTGSAPPATYQPPAPAPMPSAANMGADMFGGLAGGMGGAYQGPGSSFGERFDALGGSEPMGDNAPAPAAPAAPDGTRTYDLAPMFESGGGGGFGAGGGDTSMTGGATSGSLGGNAFSYNPYATETQDTSNQSADALAEQARAKLAGLMGGQDDKALELAVDPAAVTGRTAESAREAGGPVTSGEAVPLPRERPEGADAPRPPADIPPQELSYLKGKGPGDLKGVNQRFAKALQEFTREYNAGQGDYSIALRSGLRSGGQGFHTSGKAVDINLIDRKTGERLNDYQTRDPVVFRAYQDNANQFHSFLEKNYPDLAAQHRWGGYFWNGGPGSYGSQDIMHHDLGADRIGMGAGGWKEGLGQRSADAYGLPTGGGTATPPPQFTFDWSNAPIKDAQPIQPTYKSADGTSLYQIAPDGSHIPVPIGKGMNETTEYDPFRGTSTFAAPTVEERPGVNQGQNVAPPPADIPPPGLVGPGYNALDAAANPPAPVKHTGLELARANIDTPIEQIARERFGQKGVDEVSSMVKGMTPRQIYESYGGMFVSRAEPLFKGLGITRQDFEKAVTMPPSQQDLKMRFGGDFGGMSGEPTAGAFKPYPGWRESADFEDMRGELANLQTGATNYEPGPEVASTPLGNDLGLGNLFASEPEIAPTPLGNDLGLGGLNFKPAPTRGDLAAAVSAPNNGFSRYSDEGYGASTGRAPPVNLSPEHMRTMAQIESGQNPKDVTGSYRGLYNLKESEFRKYGGQGSIFNPEENTKAAVAKMATESQRAQDTLGRALSPVEQYLVHQQGLAGTLSHIANPDQPAWKSWQQAASSSEAKAKEVIWGNLPDTVKDQFGSVNNITSRDFINAWNTFYYQKMVESGLSPGGLSDLP